MENYKPSIFVIVIIYTWISLNLGTRKTQRFIGNVVTNCDDHLVVDNINDNGHGGGSHLNDHTTANRPVESNNTVTGETFAVVDAPERFRGGQFKMFKKRV